MVKNWIASRTSRFSAAAASNSSSKPWGVSALGGIEAPATSNVPLLNALFHVVVD
jgi:hypothetical protein